MGDGDEEGAPREAGAGGRKVVEVLRPTQCARRYTSQGDNSSKVHAHHLKQCLAILLTTHHHYPTPGHPPPNKSTDL